MLTCQQTGVQQIDSLFCKSVQVLSYGAADRVSYWSCLSKSNNTSQWPKTFDWNKRKPRSTTNKTPNTGRVNRRAFERRPAWAELYSICYREFIVLRLPSNASHACDSLLPISGRESLKLTLVINLFCWSHSYERCWWCWSSSLNWFRGIGLN